MARGVLNMRGPQEWNKLPLYIRKSSSLSIFKTQLKTYLFQLVE